MVAQTIEIHNTNDLETYFRVAAYAGMPRDQVEGFLRSGYVALPKACLFHACARLADKPDGPTEIAQGGARGPGKSHSTLAQVGDDCLRFAGLKALFLRKLAKSASESFEDLIQKVFAGVEHTYVPTRARLEFPNGSAIVLGGFRSENDIDNYLGIEYDVIALEEATQLSAKKFDMIQGSMRSTKPGWRERMYLTTNPGGIGHAWFKERYVLPQRMSAEHYTRFVPSTYKDNPFLSETYVRYLEGLAGPLGKAWRDGDWDVFEGMAFPQWDYERHTCAPFELPVHWPRWRSGDWGYSAPFAGYWFARNPDNQRIYVYQEVYGPGIVDRQQAQMFLDMTMKEHTIKTTFMDPALWTRNRQNDDLVYSTADIYMRMGVPVSRADNNRLSGKRKFDRVLADLPDGEPGIIFFRNCKNAIRTIPTLIYDTHNPEDVDTTGEDHAYDAIRYGLTDIRDEVSGRKIKKESNPLMGLKGM